MDSPTLNIEELEDLESNTFHTGTDLHTAAVNGDKLTIERILKQQGDIQTLNKGDKYGRTALVYTVSGDWFECAEILLGHGASLLQVDCDKRSVLHWAAYLDRPKFIKLFLEHLGSNLEINFGDKDCRTALHYAARQPNSKCLRLLLKRLTLNKGNLNTTDNEQMTALHWSVFYNRLENFKLLLREGAETYKRDGKGRCLLHMAVLNPSADSVRIVRILLKHNRHFSIQFDYEKHTSLHLAVGNGNQELVRELCLAEESALNYLDHLSRSVLHYAVLKNDIEIIDILISAGISPLHVDSTGASVLHYAAKNNNAQIVKRFLECFKNFEDTTDNQGRTALMWAASEGSYDVLNLMLKNLSYFNIHASDEQGMTALHVACFAGHEECVKKLIANSADITQPDKLGQTALFKACQQGHRKIIDILMDRKGSHGGTMGTHLFSIQEETAVSQDTLRNSEWSHEPTESSLIDGGESQRGEGGNLIPIDKGAFSGDCTSDSLKPEKKNHQPMKYRINESRGHTLQTMDVTGIKHHRGNLSAEFLSERLPIIHELEDENGCTPLHFAAHAGHTHVCNWLLSQGVNPGKKDAQGRTALHGAAFNGHTECMALMLSHDPDLANDRDNDGYSLLHHAATNGQLEAVKLLVSEPFQAILNYRVKSTDWTPLDFAMAADHQDVTQFLMDNGALTIAWLQDVAADKIKKFLRRLVVRKHEATVKPLIERHKQLTKEEHLKHCENKDKIRNDDLIYGNMTHEDVAHDIVDDVTHDDVTYDDVTHDDVTNNTVVDKNRSTTDDDHLGTFASHFGETEIRDNDCDNRSALHQAASLGHLDAVKLLLHSRVQDVCAKSTRLTALDCAILRQHDDVNEYMISQGLQPSGLLDQAARVIQTNFRKWLERKGISVESRGKPIKGTGKSLINNENKSKDGQTREIPFKNTENGLTNNETSLKNGQETMNTEYAVIKNENPSKSCQERAPNDNCSKGKVNKTYDSMNEKSSGIKTKSIYSTPKTDQKSRPTDCYPMRRLSENFSEGINSNSETDYSRRAVNNVTYSKHSRESRIITSPTRDHSARSSGTTLTFVQSNVEKLSRAPDSVIVASGEKDRIFQLRNNWERIALIRRKKQAALVIQKHFRKHLVEKRADDKNATKEFEVYSNETTSPKRLTRKTVVNRLRTTSPEYSSSENEPSHEKRQYKSTFPLLSPKSSATSSNRSPSNPSVIQLPNNRRPSHSNRRVEAPISPKSSSTSSNRSPSNAPVNQLPSNRRANSSPSNRRVDVAPILSKNELVNRWLSDGLVSGNSSNTKTTNKAKNTQVEASNLEPRLRKTDPSKGTRRFSSQSARIRRDSLIKNAYGSPAALSYNFALDTYHPLVSRRGRKNTTFPFRTSSRVRPNSMKRVEVGWVHTPDFVTGSTPSES